MIDGIARGLTVVEAAAEAGTTANTVRSWKRRDPGFRRRVAEAKVRSRPTGPLPTRVELLERLNEQSVGGSTTATLALLRALPGEAPAVERNPRWAAAMDRAERRLESVAE